MGKRLESWKKKRKKVALFEDKLRPILVNIAYAESVQGSFSRSISFS